MTRLKMFCFSLANENLAKIKKIDYIPVGLGKSNFDSEWLRDNTGDNISEKNSWYGENTFYYWLWKNNLKKTLTLNGQVFVTTEGFGLKMQKKKVMKILKIQ